LHVKVVVFMDETTGEGRRQDPDNQHTVPRIIGSGKLFQGQNEIWIEHEGEMYRLRIMRAGKLYLTK